MIITGIEKDPDLARQKAQLLGSLLYFTQVFFEIRTGRKFALSNPISRESHHITVCRELTKVFNGDIHRLLINLPPGHFKSTLLQHFVGWSLAHYPDCNFIYLSYSHDEASKNTAIIKSILELSQYQQFFGVKIDHSSSAKDDFKTIQGGTVKAFGSGGAVTGKDAGFPGCDRFSGALIMDDMHKPIEVHSDTIREGVWTNFNQTIKQRVRGSNVAWIFLGQCLHEDDIAAKFKKGEDGYEWNKVVLKGLDEHEHALDPAVKNVQELKILAEIDPYTFNAQYQQDPQPAGGGIFRIDNFYYLDQDPNILMTFITADTAETKKNWNDATVFSFWGLYRINEDGRKELPQFALHWLDCVEMRVEPKHLKPEFMTFYSDCCMYKVPPSFGVIERKSTGVTLVSVLEDMRGLDIRGVERTGSDGDKTARFLEIQPYVNQKLVSFTVGAKHAQMCIEHCRKITANNSHRHDDIADTLYDAVKIALIEKVIVDQYKPDVKDDIVKRMAKRNSNIKLLRERTWRN